MLIVQLRLRYRELFRADPPKAFGPDLLRRSIAHRSRIRPMAGYPLPGRHVRTESPARVSPKREFRGYLPETFENLRGTQADVATQRLSPNTRQLAKCRPFLRKRGNLPTRMNAWLGRESCSLQSPG
jgi:hypothetical protein